MPSARRGTPGSAGAAEGARGGAAVGASPAIAAVGASRWRRGRVAVGGRRGRLRRDPGLVGPSVQARRPSSHRRTPAPGGRRRPLSLPPPPARAPSSAGGPPGPPAARAAAQSPPPLSSSSRSSRPMSRTRPPPRAGTSWVSRTCEDPRLLRLDRRGQLGQRRGCGSPRSARSVRRTSASSARPGRRDLAGASVTRTNWRAAAKASAALALRVDGLRPVDRDEARRIAGDDDLEGDRDRAAVRALARAMRLVAMVDRAALLARERPRRVERRPAVASDDRGGDVLGARRSPRRRRARRRAPPARRARGRRAGAHGAGRSRRGCRPSTSTGGRGAPPRPRRCRCAAPAAVVGRAGASSARRRRGHARRRPRRCRRPRRRPPAPAPSRRSGRRRRRRPVPPPCSTLAVWFAVALASPSRVWTIDGVLVGHGHGRRALRRDVRAHRGVDRRRHVGVRRHRGVDRRGHVGVEREVDVEVEQPAAGRPGSATSGSVGSDGSGLRTDMASRSGRPSAASASSSAWVSPSGSREWFDTGQLLRGRGLRLAAGVGARRCRRPGRRRPSGSRSRSPRRRGSGR